MIDLTGRHILVFGGSRGIGAAAARMVAKAGARVSIAFQSNHEAATKFVADIENQGGRAMAIQADISSEAQVEAAVGQAVRAFGNLSGIVVSAGIFEGRFLQDMDAAFWDRTMAVNVRGTFLCVKAAAKSMRSGGKGGSIVIYASTAGQRGSAEYSAYATSKGAQILFMRSMAKELAADKIRVNCIAPAWTDTDMAAPSFESIGRDKIIEGFPLGRIGQPEDVAGATCFLLSDLASFITGSTITVDGGMDMRG